MSSCERVMNNMSAYVEGTVSGEDFAWFEDHLDSCPGCEAAVARMRTLGVRLRSLESVKTSESFQVVLRSRIRREIEAQPESFLDRMAAFFRVSGAPAYGLSVLTLLLFSYVSFDIYTHMTEESNAASTANSVVVPLTKEIETIPTTRAENDQYTQERLNFITDVMASEAISHNSDAESLSLKNEADSRNRNDQSRRFQDPQLTQTASVTF